MHRHFKVWKDTSKQAWRCVSTTIERLKDGMREYEITKGYHVESDEIEKETMRYFECCGIVDRDCGLD